MLEVSAAIADAKWNPRVSGDVVRKRRVRVGTTKLGALAGFFTPRQYIAASLFVLSDFHLYERVHRIPSDWLACCLASCTEWRMIQCKKKISQEVAFVW